MMTVAADPDLAHRNYAFPERLVSADWVAARLGTPGLIIVESDEDSLLYNIGHIPGAIKIDWTTDLNTFPSRDYITREQFATLMNRKGISRDDTVVIYGDKSNWWATYALWVFTLFGHPDVRLLDGGRDLWISSGREVVFDVPSHSTSGYPTGKRHDSTIRAYRQDVLAAIGNHPLIDTRSTEEYSGDYIYPPQGKPARVGHIPTALSIPWDQAVTDDGQFHDYQHLHQIYGFLTNKDRPIVYAHLGARSSHTWFVLTYLLGIPGVRHYDGSWIEWGNAVQVPISVGNTPGTIPTSCNYQQN